MKTFRSLLFVLVPIMVILIVVSLTSSSDDAKASFDTKKFYTATIETSEGNITVALDQQTPKATGAFVKFAEDGKYDGLCIDRIARDFVIQGGSKGCDQQSDLGPDGRRARSRPTTTRSAASPRPRAAPTRPAPSAASSSS